MTEALPPVLSDEEAARRAKLPEDAREALEEADRRHYHAALPEDETGGPAGVEPTRYGDWERKGRVSDF